MNISIWVGLGWCVLALCAGVVLGRVWFEIGRLFKALLPRSSTCQVFCPGCRQNLVSGTSVCWDGRDGLVYYTCSECGIQSRWDFDLPVPVLLGIAKPSPESRLEPL